MITIRLSHLDGQIEATTYDSAFNGLTSLLETFNEYSIANPDSWVQIGNDEVEAYMTRKPLNMERDEALVSMGLMDDEDFENKWFADVKEFCAILDKFADLLKLKPIEQC